MSDFPYPFPDVPVAKRNVFSYPIAVRHCEPLLARLRAEGVSTIEQISLRALGEGAASELISYTQSKFDNLFSKEVPFFSTPLPDKKTVYDGEFLKICRVLKLKPNDAFVPSGADEHSFQAQINRRASFFVAQFTLSTVCYFNSSDAYLDRPVLLSELYGEAKANRVRFLRGLAVALAYDTFKTGIMFDAINVYDNSGKSTTVSRSGSVSDNYAALQLALERYFKVSIGRINLEAKEFEDGSRKQASTHGHMYKIEKIANIKAFKYSPLRNRTMSLDDFYLSLRGKGEEKSGENPSPVVPVTGPRNKRERRDAAQG